MKKPNLSLQDFASANMRTLEANELKLIIGASMALAQCSTSGDIDNRSDDCSTSTDADQDPTGTGTVA